MEAPERPGEHFTKPSKNRLPLTSLEWELVRPDGRGGRTRERAGFSPFPAALSLSLTPALRPSESATRRSENK